MDRLIPIIVRARESAAPARPAARRSLSAATRRRLVASATAGLLAALALAAMPAPALADGDPASDVLATQSLFLPADARIPEAEQAQIAALLRQAAHDGVPIRAAIIAGPGDLGSIGALWHRPRAYARFLGEELSLTFHGTLLVVMPNGDGLARIATGSVTPVPVTPARSPVALASATIAAVRHVAATAGVHLTAAEPAATAGRRPVSSPLPWLSFGLGCVLVAAAWAASLRARPLRLRARA